MYSVSLLLKLNRLISQFFLRRTQAINQQYLLPKGLLTLHLQVCVTLHYEFSYPHFPPFSLASVESVVFCSMSPLQASLYSHLTQAQLRRLRCSSSTYSNDMSQHLVCIGTLKKLCNSPSLLYAAAQANSDPSDVRSLHCHSLSLYINIHCRIFLT